MLDIEDIKLIIDIIERSENKNSKLDNLVERLSILIAQDKENKEYQAKMEEYKNKLIELTQNEDIEK